MCFGQCLPPTKHYISGSYHNRLLIRAVNNELGRCLGRRVSAHRRWTRTLKRTRGGGTRTVALLQTEQLRLREVKVPGGETGGAGQAPGSLAPELTT